MTKIYLYAEILTHIRQLTLYASLQTEKREGAKVDVTTDKRIITVTHEGETQRLYLPTQIKGDATITFPLQRTTDISARVQIEDEHEWKLSINNEIDAPWMAADLTAATEIQCLKCKAPVLPSAKVSQWKALPSENWADLMDFWFCHKPHGGDNEQDAAASKGFSTTSRLAVTPGTGMVDLVSIVLHAQDCINIKAAETRTGPSLTVLRCLACAEMLGTTNEDEDLIRLHKSSIAIGKSDHANYLSYPSPIFTCAQILSLIEATALKKFVVHAAGTQYTQGTTLRPMILWVFNPDIYYSCSAYENNGVLTRAGPANTVAMEDSPKEDDTKRSYADEVKTFGNNDTSASSGDTQSGNSQNSSNYDMSQLGLKEPSKPQRFADDIAIEVPTREKKSAATMLSEIPIEEMLETETPLITSFTSEGRDHTDQQTSHSEEQQNDHINLVHRAAKIFYKPLPADTNAIEFLDDNSTTFEELYLPNPADFVALRETLENSTANLPASARAFQDWNVGLLDRYEKVPSGLGVMQENPLARGIQAKDGRVTRWDLGHGAEGLYA